MKTLFFVWGAVLLLTACGGGRQEAGSVGVQPIRTDSLVLPETLFLGHVCQVRVYDSVLYIWDLRNPSMMLAVAYPSLETLCSFLPKGKGPEEMLEIGGFDADDRYLYVMASREPKLAIYAQDSLRAGIQRPLRMVACPNEVAPSFAFAKGGGDTLILQNARPNRRVLLCDTAGHLLRAQYPMPENEETQNIEPLLMPYLWMSRMACREGRVALVTRLGEVLEICDPADTVQAVVVVGRDGIPGFTPEGVMGRVNGFMDVRIFGGKVFAVYSGMSMQEVDRMLDEKGYAPSGGRYFRVYDLSTGELERVYELDRYISSFDILPDGRTVVAADPTAEHQLCTFTLPEW